MSFPCQRITPLSGDNRPHSIRRKLVFPLPFSPTTARRLPGLTVTLTSENSCRSPRLPLSATVSNIFGEIPPGPNKKNCRSFESFWVVLFVSVFSTPSEASYVPTVPEAVVHPDGRCHCMAIGGLMNGITRHIADCRPSDTGKSKMIGLG